MVDLVHEHRTTRHTTLPFVQADGVRRTYQQGLADVRAVVAATCSVHPGDRIALVGPSGSGKSTLLHLMGGLDTPTSGTLTWPGLGPSSSLRPRHIAIVFQTPSLLAPLNVVENVELPLLLSDIDADEARTAALDALERMQLHDLAAKLPEELSGGQAQRVALARAVAHRPKLILADEPTGQLDRVTADQVLAVLLSALDGSDTAVVIATHDPAVAARMDQVWSMQHGYLEVRV